MLREIICDCIDDAEAAQIDPNSEVKQQLLKARTAVIFDHQQA